MTTRTAIDARLGPPSRRLAASEGHPTGGERLVGPRARLSRRLAASEGHRTGGERLADRRRVHRALRRSDGPGSGPIGTRDRSARPRGVAIRHFGGRMALDLGRSARGIDSRGPGAQPRPRRAALGRPRPRRAALGRPRPLTTFEPRRDAATPVRISQSWATVPTMYAALTPRNPRTYPRPTGVACVSPDEPASWRATEDRDASLRAHHRTPRSTNERARRRRQARGCGEALR
jgi:hypothetical protein